MDPGSRKTFDLSYYKLLPKRRGLFQSDAALTTNSNALASIKQLLRGSLQKFFTEFANSMEKLGRINFKTGNTVRSGSNVLWLIAKRHISILISDLGVF